MGAVQHTQRTRARVLALFAVSGRIDQACESVGVERTSHYRWLKKYPDYATAFEQAREEAADLLEAEAWRRAREGVQEPVFNGGKRAADFVYDEKGEVVKDPETGRPKSQPAFVRKHSDQLLMFLLKGRRPKVYGDKVEATGKGGVALFGVEACRAYMQSVPDDEE